MSDSLKDRLSSHSNSFEGLLSLIPARYYYDDESNSQWKKGTASAEERKAESKNNRRSKFDPDVGSSALDELKRREQASESAGPQNDENDLQADGGDHDVVIYDDNGNPIGGEVEESIEELLRRKAQNPEELQDQQASKPQVKNEPKSDGKQQKKAKAENKQQSKSEGGARTAEPKPAKESIRKEVIPNKKDGAGEGTISEEKSSEENDAQQDTTSDENQQSTQEENGTSNEEVNKKSKKGIEELRARLAARVNELKAKRKAPGSDAQGAPKNREELLAARKLRLEQKKNQSLKRGHDDNDDDDDEDDDENDDADMSIDEERGNASSNSNKKMKEDIDTNLMFGQVRFSDGARLGNDASSIEEERKRKKRNSADQLRVLESRKAKIGNLDKSKQDEIAENAKWSRAILQSEGAKIRDDEKLLRKTIRQKQNRKKRSEKEWKQRIYNVKKGISDRESKRHANISAHKEAKKLRLKGKKRKQHMKSVSK